MLTLVNEERTKTEHAEQAIRNRLEREEAATQNIERRLTEIRDECFLYT